MKDKSGKEIGQGLYYNGGDTPQVELYKIRKDSDNNFIAEDYEKVKRTVVDSKLWGDESRIVEPLKEVDSGTLYQTVGEYFEVIKEILESRRNKLSKLIKFMEETDR